MKPYCVLKQNGDREWYHNGITMVSQWYHNGILHRDYEDKPAIYIFILFIRNDRFDINKYEL